MNQPTTVCIYKYMFVGYICIHIDVWVYDCSSVYLYICMRVHLYKNINVYMYECVSV